MSKAIVTTGEPTINIPQLKRIIRDDVIEDGDVAFFYGEAGIGKTYAIRQACEAADAYLCEIRLGQYDSVDLRGFPGVDALNGTTCWYPPKTLPIVGTPGWPTDKPIVIFYDEATSATMPVWAVMYQALQDGGIGEHKFMPNVRQCAAGNLDTDRGVVNRTPAPVSNRCINFRVALDVAAWIKYMATLGTPPLYLAYHGWRGKEGKNILLSWDPDAAVQPKSYGSPRSWERAIRKHRKYAHVDPDHAFLAMAGSIGEGLALDFRGFEQIFEKVLRPEDIIKNPKGCKLPDDESLIYATAVSVSGAMDLTNVKPLHTFLTRLDPEYVIMAWQLAVARNPAIYMADEFLDVSQRYKAIFDATTKKAA